MVNLLFYCLSGLVVNMKCTTEEEKSSDGKLRLIRLIERTTGLVESLQDGIVKLPPEARMTGTEIEGTYFTIRTNEGVDEFGWPKKFSPPEQDALLGQTVDYRKEHTTFPAYKEFANNLNYTLEVLYGQYRGWKLERRFSFGTYGCIL